MRARRVVVVFGFCLFFFPVFLLCATALSAPPPPYIYINKPRHVPPKGLNPVAYAFKYALPHMAGRVPRRRPQIGLQNENWPKSAWWRPLVWRSPKALHVEIYAQHYRNIIKLSLHITPLQQYQWSYRELYRSPRPSYTRAHMAFRIIIGKHHIIYCFRSRRL